MHIVFRNMDEWYKKDPDLKAKFQDTFKYITSAAKEYGETINNQQVLRAQNISIRLRLSGMLLKQSLIDAYDDLMRLKDYHLTTDPSPLKEMSYIVFWLLRHKPITLESDEDIINNAAISEMVRTRILFINESFCVYLLLMAAFPSRKMRDGCTQCVDEGKMQLNYFKKFLLYYLVYRLDSPKSLEAILLGITIFPVWEVDPVIWSTPQDPVNQA